MAMTLFQHVRQRHTPELAALITAIADGAATIERRIRTAGLDDILGAAGSENVQGEAQQKLDVLADNTLIEVMKAMMALVRTNPSQSTANT